MKKRKNEKVREMEEEKEIESIKQNDRQIKKVR